MADGYPEKRRRNGVKQPGDIEKGKRAGGKKRGQKDGDKLLDLVNAQGEGAGRQEANDFPDRGMPHIQIETKTETQFPGNGELNDHVQKSAKDDAQGRA